MASKYIISATGRVAAEFINVEAVDKLPKGAPAGGNPGRDPVDGTVEILGTVAVVAPSDWGAGAGAKTESLVTYVGGATRGGNCIGPALFCEMQFKI